jgi:hypothetical protein
MSTTEKKKRKNELKELQECEIQLKDWLRDVEQKIYELEGQYLDETPMGNILKGWEVDGKPSSRIRSIDEKERLFSNSSYRVYMEGKFQSNDEMGRGRKANESSYQPKKKARRSIKKEGIYDDWDNDY